MLKILINIVLSILFSTSFLYQFITDYKREHYVIASFELVCTIIFMTIGICCTAGAVLLEIFNL